MKDQLHELIDKLLNAKDLTEAQAIAVDLQWAVYEYLERLREGESEPKTSKSATPS